MFLKRRPKVWVGSGANWSLHKVFTDPSGHRYIYRYSSAKEAWFLEPDGTIYDSLAFRWRPYDKE